jgi:hypothetical protein
MSITVTPAGASSIEQTNLTTVPGNGLGASTTTMEGTASGDPDGWRGLASAVSDAGRHLVDARGAYLIPDVTHNVQRASYKIQLKPCPDRQPRRGRGSARL